MAYGMRWLEQSTFTEDTVAVLLAQRDSAAEEANERLKKLALPAVPELVASGSSLGLQKPGMELYGARIPWGDRTVGLFVKSFLPALREKNNTGTSFPIDQFLIELQRQNGS